jgi:hypothetical protein
MAKHMVEYGISPHCCCRENVRAEPNRRRARNAFSFAVGERQLMTTLREYDLDRDNNGIACEKL